MLPRRLAAVVLLLAFAAGASADTFTCGVSWRVSGQQLSAAPGNPTQCQVRCEKIRACQFFFIVENANAPQRMTCYVMGAPGGQKQRDDNVQLVCARDAVWPALGVPENLVGNKGTFIPGRGAGARAGAYRKAATSTGVIAIHATMVPGTDSVVFFGRPQDPKYPPQPFMEIDKTGVEWPSSILNVRNGKYYPVPWNMGAPFCAHQVHTVNGDILVCGGDDDFVGQPGNGNWGGTKGCRYLTKTAKGYVWYKFGDLTGGHWYPSIVELPPRVSGSRGTCAVVIGGLSKAPYPKYDLTDRVDMACLQMGLTFGLSVYDAASTPNVAASLRQMYPVTYLLPVGDVPDKPVLVLFGEISGDVVTLDIDFRAYKFSFTSVKALPAAPEDKFTFTAPSSSVLKAIDMTRTSDDGAVEVLIFGGAYYPDGPFVANGKVFRIKPLLGAPQWEVEPMPSTAVMREAINLPNGKVLLINGARLGKAGGGRVCCSSMAGGPILQVWIYNPDAPRGRRFWVDPTLMPHYRLYHGTAWLGRDGQIYIAGGDQAPIPNNRPGFAMDAYIPPGLLRAIYTKTRPNIRSAPTRFSYGSKLVVRITGGYASRCSLSKPVAVTHATGSSQRMVLLRTLKNAMDRKNIRKGGYLVVEVPTSAYVMPPGYLLLYCWHGDVWSTAMWTYLNPK